MSEVLHLKEYLTTNNKVLCHEMFQISGDDIIWKPGLVKSDIELVIRNIGASIKRLRQENLPNAFDRLELMGHNVEVVSNCELKNLNVLDVFSGAGGLSLGLNQAARLLGLKPTYKAAIELNDIQLAIYQKNFRPRWAQPGSASDLIDYRVRTINGKFQFSYKPEFLDPYLKAAADKTDIIIAGPPCQGHSTFNNKTRGNDPRNSLYLSAVAAAIASNASAVVIENVPRVENDWGKAVDAAVDLLEANGFKVGFRGTLAGLDFGVPQSRNRHFLVASKNTAPDVEGISHIFKTLPRSVGWAIRDLKSMKPGEDDLMNSVPVLSEENQKRIDFLFDNNLYDLPNHIRPDCHKDGHTYPSVYGRLEWKKPALTITQGFLSPGRGRYIHPLCRRTLTCHEAARLQTFPDGYDFLHENGPLFKNTLTKAIGEAVPPLLGRVPITAALLTLV